MSQPQHTELLGLSLQQLTEVVEGFGQAPYRARQLLDGLYRQRWSVLEQFTTLPLAFRQQLSESGYGVGLPRIEKKFVSIRRNHSLPAGILRRAERRDGLDARR